MNESKDKRKGWLRELKKGDLVALVLSTDNDKGGIYSVASVTPTGYINLSSGHKIKPDGWVQTSGGYARHHYQLASATPERVGAIRENNEKIRISNHLNDFDFRTINLDDLRKIKEIIENR